MINVINFVKIYNMSASERSTEDKIKEAARSVFHRKGYAATRTRDIAEEAGMNLALLNYYFRSKEKLFKIIMLETMQLFFNSLATVVNDDTTTLKQKIELIVERYLDMLMKEPDLPIFFISEIRNNPEILAEKMNLKNVLIGSIFFQQLFSHLLKKGIQETPFHFIMNILGMIVFPIVAKPVIQNIGGFDEVAFNDLLIERKRLIPKWIGVIMDIDE